MCGIAGYFRLDGGPASADDAARMAASMAHRGPDGHGTWADGPAALAHVRLAVRDLTQAAAQPMRAPGGEGVLVYNGEVYNDGALRAELAREGASFRGTGDAEVVLHALARWGPAAAVPRFDGMFALAWWDARDRSLWLARDRFGIKPLHVVVAADRVAFASEVRGLRAIGLASRPDLLEAVRRVLCTVVEERRPPFEGVENVLPGEIWRVDAGGTERRRWFEPIREVDVDRLVAAAREPAEAWADRARAAVEAAVRSHLASDAPVAAFTSGGVDSNLVAAIAREERRDLVAYTADMAHPESEIEAATAMARHLGIPLRVVRVDREAHLRHWADAILALEHPSPNPSYTAGWLVARAAHADGVKVAMTGEGADELFGGYDFFRATRDRWRAGRSPLRRLLSHRAPRRRDLRETPFAQQPLAKDRSGHRRLAALLAPVEEARPHALLERLARVRPATDRAVIAHTIDALDRYLGWILLRHDRLCMASAVEARVPFLSAGVADVALHLPAGAKVRGRTGKWVLKRVAAQRLPRRLVYARKRGYPLPNDHHRGAASLLRGGAVPALLGWTREAEEVLVPRIEADPTLRQQMAGMEIWARLFVRGERPAEVTDRLLSAAGKGP